MQRSAAIKSASRRNATASMSKRREQERARNNKKAFSPYAESNEGKDNSGGRAREAAEIMKRRANADSIRTQYMPLAAARPKNQVPFDKVRVPYQKFFLVHIMQRFVRPQSMKPAVRIMGGFETYDDALEHYETVLKPVFENDWDQRCFEQGQKFALMAKYKGYAPDVMNAKIADIEAAHGIQGSDSVERRYQVWAKDAMAGRVNDDEDEEEEDEKTRLENAKARTEARRLREVEALEKSVIRIERKATELANTKTARKQAVESKIKTGCTVGNRVKTASLRVPANCMLHDQKFAAISVLKDITEGALEDKAAEPMVIIWGAFKTIDEANAWVNQGQKHVLDYDIHIVDMYEPLPVQNVDFERISTTYRNEHQNEIMGSIDRGHRNVQDFEEFCEEQDLEVPTTDIEILDHGKKVNVRKTGQGISKNTVQASKEIVDKDLPTDQAKFADDPLYVPKKEALRRLAAHEESWKSVPKCKVVDRLTGNVLYGEGDDEVLIEDAPEEDNRVPIRGEPVQEDDQ